MPSPRRRIRMTAPERRAAILEAAMEAFATRGYHGTSIDDVAQAAGISKALIYEHFDSKRDLHATLVTRHAHELFARLQAGTAAGADREARLRGGVEAFLRFVEERREAWRALFRDAADPELGEVLDRVQREATEEIVALMLAGAEPGAPTPSARDVEITAQLLSGAVQGLGTWWYDHQDVPRAVLVDRVMGFAWLGLERIGAGERLVS